MALGTIDEAAYGKLLARALPRVIKTEAENERMIADSKGSIPAAVRSRLRRKASPNS